MIIPKNTNATFLKLCKTDINETAIQINQIVPNNVNNIVIVGETHNPINTIAKPIEWIISNQAKLRMELRRLPRPLKTRPKYVKAIPRATKEMIPLITILIGLIDCNVENILAWFGCISRALGKTAPKVDTTRNKNIEIRQTANIAICNNWKLLKFNSNNLDIPALGFLAESKNNSHQFILI